MFIHTIIPTYEYVCNTKTVPKGRGESPYIPSLKAWVLRAMSIISNLEIEDFYRIRIKYLNGTLSLPTKG